MNVKASRQRFAFLLCTAYSFSKTNPIMKKTALLIIGFVCFCIASRAQISKGSTFLGGSFGLSSSSSKDDVNTTNEGKNSGFSISPQIGKAIGNNKILGVYLGYNQSTNTSTYGTQKQETKNNGYSAGVFYRQYYPLSNRFYLFGQGSFGWSTSKEKYTNNALLQRENDNNAISFSITPGLSYAAGRKLHLEASLNDLA